MTDLKSGWDRISSGFTPSENNKFILKILVLWTQYIKKWLTMHTFVMLKLYKYVRNYIVTTYLLQKNFCWTPLYYFCMHLWDLHSDVIIELNLIERKCMQIIVLNSIELKWYIWQAAWDVSAKLMITWILVPMEYAVTIIFLKTDLFQHCDICF